MCCNNDNGMCTVSYGCQRPRASTLQSPVICCKCKETVPVTEVSSRCAVACCVVPCCTVICRFGCRKPRHPSWVSRRHHTASSGHRCGSAGCCPLLCAASTSWSSKQALGCARGCAEGLCEFAVRGCTTTSANCSDSSAVLSKASHACVQSVRCSC